MNASVMNFVKATTTYEVVVNDNKYQFVIPANSPIGETYDVAFKFLSIIAEQAKLTADAVKPAADKSGTDKSGTDKAPTEEIAEVVDEKRNKGR
jgi:hypothetical protein